MIPTMEAILSAQFGETCNEITAGFKKTIKTGEFETEVLSCENKMTVNGQMSGAERIIVESVLTSQLEYEVYVRLFKGLKITQSAFEERKRELEATVQIIKEKCEIVTGKNFDSIFTGALQGKNG